MNQEPIMYSLIAAFPAQIREAVQTAKQSNISTPQKQIRNVIIAGMGGSGIGGTILKEIAYGQSAVPIEVVKDYQLPAYCNEHTLLIASSYSGNTEETLACVKEAFSRGACIKVVSSGGDLIEAAKQNNFDFVQIPSGMPPRAGLAYSLVTLCHIASRCGIVEDLALQFIAAAEFLEKKQQDIKTQAVQIARKIAATSTAIYACSGFAGVAIRLAQQLHENAKQHAWVNTFPELNHNELVSWHKESKNISVLNIRSDKTFQRNLHRVSFSEKIIKPLCAAYAELFAEGDTELQQLLFVIHLGDFISWYTSLENRVDAMDIEIIEALKKSLQTI